MHTHDFKELSKDRPIEAGPQPAEVALPLRQHIGAPARPVVAKGDIVRRGQLIAEPGGFISAGVHASVSGKVKAIEARPHALGKPVDAIVIENDGRNEWADGLPGNNDVSALSAENIRAKVQAAGIVGLGGATFPTHVKLSPPPDMPIDSVIINAVECEPYLTRDYRLMLERTADVVAGLRLIMTAVGAERGYIAVEANKLDAYEEFCEATAEFDDISVELLAVKYPQGAELQLIEAVLNRQVPSGELPMAAGAVVQNVATAVAIYEACRYDLPLTELVVTVTGEGAGKPGNLLVPLGTPIDLLLAHCEAADNINKLIIGGPMMGLAQYTAETTVTKGTSGIVLLTDAEEYDYGPCIRCGRCVEHCPMGLVPSDLSIVCEAGRVEEMLDHNIMDCKECGTCAYVCPARRPIVHWVKLGKAALARQKARQASK